MLQTKFFLLRFMAQAWNAQAIHNVKKARFCNLQYRPRKTRLARCLLYLWVKIEAGKISIQAEWPLMIDVHQCNAAGMSITFPSTCCLKNPSNCLHLYFVFLQYLTTFWVPSSWMVIFLYLLFVFFKKTPRIQLESLGALLYFLICVVFLRSVPNFSSRHILAIKTNFCI